jgi:hypothetical protein
VAIPWFFGHINADTDNKTYRRWVAREFLNVGKGPLAYQGQVDTAGVEGGRIRKEQTDMKLLERSEYESVVGGAKLPECEEDQSVLGGVTLTFDE